MKYKKIPLEFPGWDEYFSMLEYVNDSNELESCSIKLLWSASAGAAYFKHEEDAIAFRLRFGL